MIFGLHRPASDHSESTARWLTLPGLPAAEAVSRFTTGDSLPAPEFTAAFTQLMESEQREGCQYVRILLFETMPLRGFTCI